jgi:hypothetical protein
VPVGSAFVEGNGVDGPLVEIRKGAPIAPAGEPAVVANP